jgi:hypothetical protein
MVPAKDLFVNDLRSQGQRFCFRVLSSTMAYRGQAAQAGCHIQRIIAGYSIVGQNKTQNVRSP